MGWASGSELMSKFIAALKPRVKSAEIRRSIYEALIPAMQNSDWDTEVECLGEDDAYDAALKNTNPEMFEPED